LDRVLLWGVGLVIVLVAFAFVIVLYSANFTRSPRDHAVRLTINNSRDIYISFRDYALENGGQAPPAEENSNKALRVLFEKGFCLDEKPFSIEEIPEFIGNCRCILYFYRSICTLPCHKDDKHESRD